MSLFEQFPYTNLHELNLDWCLRVAESAKEHLDGYDEDMAAIAQSKTDAENAATAAAGSAASAAASAADTTQAQNAEAWAVGTKNGVAVGSSAPQYHNNSKYWSDQAASSASSAAASAADTTQAQQAEAWAKGTKNGVPVTSDEPQYENNAKYWAEQSGDAVDAYMPYSIGNCIAYLFSSPNPITVKASRTLTKADGTTASINYSGCIALLEPADWNATGGVISGNLQASDAECWVVNVIASGGKYIGFDVTVADVFEVVNGVQRRVRLFQMYDVTTGQYLADNTQIYSLQMIATNGKSSIPDSWIKNGDAGQDLS